ncbi:hypothetical protein SELMODRAFT_419933 [Selaginella moellendorffii]|uniref:Uncharacterized protein n=1 Tax=Selaginella moellendorffii TaxID=88036 RepID=D8SA17_SELML|nr:hypothetical protein SELMODRAFT_419933 [Selaginella moellendorffii]
MDEALNLARADLSWIPSDRGYSNMFYWSALWPFYRPMQGIKMNKPLYSFSYMCFTAGAAGAVFCLLYILVDVYDIRYPTLLLEWMGMNSLIIYTLAATDVLVVFVQGFYWKQPQKNLDSNLSHLRKISSLVPPRPLLRLSNNLLDDEQEGDIWCCGSRFCPTSLAAKVVHDAANSRLGATMHGDANLVCVLALYSRLCSFSTRRPSPSSKKAIAKGVWDKVDYLPGWYNPYYGVGMANSSAYFFPATNLCGGRNEMGEKKRRSKERPREKLASQLDFRADDMNHAEQQLQRRLKAARYQISRGPDRKPSSQP